MHEYKKFVVAFEIRLVRLKRNDDTFKTKHETNTKLFFKIFIVILHYTNTEPWELQNQILFQRNKMN
jgi:hypothetical protein